MLLTAISNDDVSAVIRALVARAKAGDVVCARELFDRLLGKSSQKIDLDLMAHTKADLIHDDDAMIVEALRLGTLYLLPPALLDRE